MKKQEIERKFLLLNDEWKENIFEIKNIKQTYLDNRRRIRIENNKIAYETIKTPINHIEEIKEIIDKFNIKNKEWLFSILDNYWDNSLVTPLININKEIIKFSYNSNVINIDININLDNKLGSINFEEHLKNQKRELNFNIKSDIYLCFDLINIYKNFKEFGVNEDEKIIDYEEGLNLIKDKILLKKERHLVMVGLHLWEIDVFKNLTEELTMAEIELKNINESFIRPSWLGKELTGNKDYSNYNLIKKVNDFNRKCVI